MFSVGVVLYSTCIPLSLAWWRQHDVTSIAKWRGQASSWLLAIWHSPIAESLLVIWQSCIAKELLTIWRSCMANAHWQFGNILLLSSNNRISSFYWIRGIIIVFSKVSLILIATFLSSIFVQSLLTSFFATFSAAWESDFLSCFLVPLLLQRTTLYMHPHIFGTHHAFFRSKMLAGTWY